MKRMLFSMFAAMGLLALAGVTVSAQDARYAGMADEAAATADAGSCNSCCDSMCDDCCDDGCGSWIAIGELTFFRYHRADGVRAGATGLVGNNDAEFDFEVAPRVTIGYQGGDGLGVRVRWWDYHHTAGTFEPVVGDNNGITVETYTLDFEVFDTVQLNSVWTAEISAGIRINEFEEVMRLGAVQYRENDFEGFGGVVGLELKRCIGEGSAVFARVRGAILMDDKFVANGSFFPATGIFIGQADTLLDSTQGMLEIALGYEANWDLDYDAVMFARVSAEWQNWYNYSSAFSPIDNDANFGGASDVGFGGFVASLGFAY